MKLQRPDSLLLLLLLASSMALGDEGYSSAQPSVPASIYYRAFTLYTLPEACASSPGVSRLALRLTRTTIRVGDRIHANTPDDSVVSDLIVEAFDEDGNFLPAVPIHVSASSEGRTVDHDPGVIYRDASMDYWEARRPGRFGIEVSWACAFDAQDLVQDRVTLEVLAAGG